MKIAVICTSDTIGGAAISTTRLTNALSKHGAEAQLIVLKKGSKNLRVEEAGGDFEKKLAFYTERLKIYLNNGFSRKNLFKVSTASDGIKLADSWFAHLAFEVPGENSSNEWLEPVTDEEYNKLAENK